MKITFVVAADNLAGGNRVTAIHAEHLQQLGHEVNVIVPRPRDVSKRERVLQALRAIKRGDAPEAAARLLLPIVWAASSRIRSPCSSAA